MLQKKLSTHTLARNSRRKQTNHMSVWLVLFIRVLRSARRGFVNFGFLCRRKMQKSVTFKMLRTKRIPLYQVPMATVKMTLHAVKWVVLLVLLYLCLGFVILLFQDGVQSMRDIIIYQCRDIGVGTILKYQRRDQLKLTNFLLDTRITTQHLQKE